jgi:hypothetical protein
MRRALGLLLAVGLLAAMPAALAAFTSTSNASGSVTAAPDWTGPTATASVIAKQTGYLAGAIKQGGTYFVYANVTDSGNPASGVSTVRADVNNVTVGQTNVTMTAGSYSINGVSYAYRSAALTAAAVLSAGSKTYTMNSTDVLGYPGSQNFSVTVDNTAPSASDIQTTNHAGGVSGKAEIGDTIIFTFSEQIDPQSILAGWTGASTNVVVYLEDGGCTLILCGADWIDIYNGGSQLNSIGWIDLNDAGYTGGSLLGSAPPTIFGATGTASTMVQSGATITITLGTRSGSSADTGTSTTMAWDSATSPYDAAGNANTGTTRNETGGGDREF